MVMPAFAIIQVAQGNVFIEKERLGPEVTSILYNVSRTAVAAGMPFGIQVLHLLMLCSSLLSGISSVPEGVEYKLWNL